MSSINRMAKQPGFQAIRELVLSEVEFKVSGDGVQ